MVEEPTIVSADAEHIIGTWRNVAVAVWRGLTTVQHMDIAAQAVRQLSLSGKQNLAYLTIIESTSPSPTPDVRDASLKLIREGQRSVQCWALVSEATGFQASLVRSVMTGLLLVFKPASPLKILPSVPEAANWMSHELDAKKASFGRPSELVEAVRRMREIASNAPRQASV